MVMVCGVGVMNHEHVRTQEMAGRDYFGEDILWREYIFGEDTGENGNGGMHSTLTHHYIFWFWFDHDRRPTPTAAVATSESNSNSATHP